MQKARTLAQDAGYVPDGCRWLFEGSNEVMVKYKDRVVYDGSMLWVSDQERSRTDFRRLNFQYSIDEFLDKLEIFIKHRWPRSLGLISEIRAKKDQDPDYHRVLDKWCSGAPDTSTVELRDTICAPFQFHECVTSQIVENLPGYGYHSLAYANIWTPLDTCGMFARNAFVHPLCKYISDNQIAGTRLTFAFFGPKSQQFYETNYEGYSKVEASAKKPGSTDAVAAIAEMSDYSRSYIITTNGRTFVGLGFPDVDGLSTTEFIASERETLISNAFTLAHSGPARRFEINVERSSEDYPSSLDRAIKEQAAYYGLSVEEHGRRMGALTAAQELIDDGQICDRPEPSSDSEMDGP